MIRSQHIRWILIVALLSGFVGTVLAEISATPRLDGRVDTLTMGDLGITDGIDPIPQIWQPYRDVPQDWILNADGAVRGDGPPDVFVRNGSSWPAAAWAYYREEMGQFDIALSLWQGNAWGPIEFLTNTPWDELDPRLYIESNGRIHVVWWVPGSEPRVEIMTRTANGDLWSTPSRVNSLVERGRRPTVAIHNSTTWIAYERDTTEGMFQRKEVAVRRLAPDETFVLEYVAPTEFEEDVDPVLHVTNGMFWMDWRYSEDQFAYGEILDLPDEGANIESWNDVTWVGVESVRRIIATLVSAGHTLPDEGTPVEP